MNSSHTYRKQTGNKGEAFIQELFCDYAIVHKIDGSNDVGLDFLCEWLKNEKPTGLLFGLQVKTTRKVKNFTQKGKQSNTNFLDEFSTSQISSIKISDKTLGYWRNFNFPIFLFIVMITESSKLAFYKRYTTILHEIKKERELPFYLANDDIGLRAYIYKEKTWGFCRDLYFDHLRCQHFQGMLSGVDPNDLGLSGWKKDAIYEGVFDNYKEKINEAYVKYETWKKFFT